MTYEIHSNIPVPPEREKQAKLKYRLNELKLQQCIILKTEREINNAREAAYRYSRKNKGWDYTTRRLETDDGWGLWRIK